jgi:RNA polymerase sigma-70 factor (ECF subfamily)
LDDRELWNSFRGGEPRALEALLERHESGLLRYAWQITGSRDLAQDVVQEAFLALVRGARNGTSIEYPAAWLFRVTRNRAKDLLKREKRMRQRHETVAVEEAVPPKPSPIEAEESHRALAERFGALPSDVQEVLALKVQEKKSYREISVITGFSLGKISALVHRGLDELTTALKSAGVV